MKQIEIKKIDAENGVFSIEWENNVSGATMMSLVFDDDGSCTNIGIDPESNSFSTSVIDPGKYLVTLSAFDGSTWIKSDTLVIEI